MISVQTAYVYNAHARTDDVCMRACFRVGVMHMRVWMFVCLHVSARVDGCCVCKQCTMETHVWMMFVCVRACVRASAGVNNMQARMDVSASRGFTVSTDDARREAETLEKSVAQ